MEESNNIGILVLPYIAESTRLSFGKKLMMGLIYGLSLKKGYCYATNAYMAQCIGTSEDAVKKMIQSLKDDKLILITDTSKKKRERKITLPNLEKFTQATQKTLDALTPEVEPETLQVSVEETPNYDNFVPQKKAPKTTNIINVGQIVLTERMRHFASDKGYSDVQTEEVFEHFLNHHLSKGNTFKDWDRAFNTWILNQKSFKKNFSDAPARKSSSPSLVGQRLMLENILLEDDKDISLRMIQHRIYHADVMSGAVVLDGAFSDIGARYLSTTKHGVKPIWFFKSKWVNNHCDDIVIDVIEHTGDTQ